MEVPAGVPIQYKTSFLPGAAAESEEIEGAHRLVVSLEHLEPSVNSDIDLSTHVPRAPSVDFSTGASWLSIATAYFQLAEPQVRPDEIKSMLPSSLPHDRVAATQALVSSLQMEESREP